METVKQGERCGGCGYWLRGLGDQGRCPECGMEFRPEEMVIFSRDASTQILIVFGSLLAAYGVMFALLVLLGGRVGRPGVWPGLIGGFVGPLVTIVFTMRRRQVRFSREGWGTRFRYGAVKMKAWDGHTMELKRAQKGVYLLRIKKGWNALVLMQIGCPENEVQELRARMQEVTGQKVVMK